MTTFGISVYDVNGNEIFNADGLIQIFSTLGNSFLGSGSVASSNVQEVFSVQLSVTLPGSVHSLLYLAKLSIAGLIGNRTTGSIPYAFVWLRDAAEGNSPPPGTPKIIVPFPPVARLDTVTTTRLFQLPAIFSKTLTALIDIPIDTANGGSSVTWDSMMLQVFKYGGP